METLIKNLLFLARRLEMQRRSECFPGGESSPVAECKQMQTTFYCCDRSLHFSVRQGPFLFSGILFRCNKIESFM